MKRNLLFTLLISVLVLVISCSTAKKKADVLVTQSGVFPRYLELIPSDTPYVLASTEALPEQVVDLLLEKFRPLAKKVGNSSFIKRVPAMEVLWEEVGQKLLDPKGFETLGLVKSPTFLVYGVGVLPVFRIQISDGEKVRALFKRVESRIGITSHEEKRGEQFFWSYTNADAILPFAVIGDELVFGITHRDAAQLYAKHLMGEVKPKNSFAQANKIEQITAEYGFTRFLVGFVDFRKIFESLVVESTSLNSQIAGLLPGFRSTLDPVCNKEISELIEQAPRMVMGYDKIDSKVMIARVGLEVNNGLAADVAATKTSLPLSGQTVPDTLLSVSAGFDFGKLINVVQARVRAIQDAPFQCSSFRKINDMASNSAALAMIPPAITEIKGFAFGLRDVENIDVSNGDPNTWPKYKNYVDGYAAIRSDNPRNLLDVLSLALRDLPMAKITQDLSPINLTLPPGVDEFKKPSLMLSNTYLGLSAGMTTAQDLGKALKEATDKASTPFGEVRYKMAAYFDIMEKITNQNMGSNDEETKEILGSMKSIFNSSESTIEFIPEERGFFVRFEQTL